MAIKQTGVSSKFCKLGYWTNEATAPTSTTVKDQSKYTWLDDLQSIPAMGGKKDSIEITTLQNSSHVFMSGLDSYSDSLDFVFLKRPIDTAAQSPTPDQMLSLLTKVNGGDSAHWAVLLTDKCDSTGEQVAGATICTFEATGSVGIDASGLNGALTYTLSLKPGTEIKMEASTKTA